MANDSSIVMRLRLLGRAAFAGEARRAGQDLGALDRAGRKVNTVMAAMAVGGAAAAAGIGVVVSAIARMGSETNATQDAQRVSFTALLKSRSKAASMMKEIQQLALDSPILDPATTGDAVRMLIAYGINAKKVIPLVRALGDMSAASGKSIVEVMPRAALALGQIEGKGKLQAQEMNQLAESVGLSRKSIRKELGLTAKEFEDTFKPGKNIKSNVAVPAIMRAMTKQAAGAADMLAKTTAGRIARGKEVMKLAAGDFTRPFYDAVGVLASKAGDKLSSLQSGGGIKSFSRGLFTGQRAQQRRSGMDRDYTSQGKAQNTGAKVRATVASIGRGIGRVGSQILDALKPAEPFLKNILLPLLKGVAKGVLGGVVAAFKIAVPVIKALMSGLGWIGEKAGPKAKKIFETIGTVIGFIFGPAILRVLGYLGKLGFVFRILAVPARILGSVVKGVAWGLGRVFAALGWIYNKVRPVVAVFKIVGGYLFPRVAAVAGRVAAAFGRVRDKVVPVFRRGKELAGALRDKLAPAFDVVKKSAGAVGTVVSALLTPMKEAYKLGQKLGIFDDGPTDTLSPGYSNIFSRNDVLNPRDDTPNRSGTDSSSDPAGNRDSVRMADPVAQRNGGPNTFWLQIDGKPVHAAVVREERRRVEATK